MLNKIKRFFTVSPYLCGCSADIDFKWWERASNWILIAENNTRENINKRYYEDEYNKIYEELHLNTKLTNISIESKNMLDSLEERRTTIENNRIQIIKDLNRTFNKSSSFGEGTKGRDQLMDVLEVVSFKYTGIGYVQGMNFVVAALLYHSTPTVTLGLISYMFENFQLWDIYAENLVGVHYHNSKLTELTIKYLPKLSDHLK